jgi:hypothetical protein
MYDNACVAGTPSGPKKTEDILKNLESIQMDRQRLIANIGECLNRLRPIEERPRATENKQPKQPKEGFFGVLEGFLDIMREDNERLDILYENLAKIS